mmetsp:Transcript_11587/g.32633  ORF Transcript_11587/g.32633 Transcript_11587/m.32633 type:complete len:227 (+) Transcript_11587:1616-2296(+)
MSCIWSRCSFCSPLHCETRSAARSSCRVRFATRALASVALSSASWTCCLEPSHRSRWPSRSTLHTSSWSVRFAVRSPASLALASSLCARRSASWSLASWASRAALASSSRSVRFPARSAAPSSAACRRLWTSPHLERSASSWNVRSAALLSASALPSWPWEAPRFAGPAEHCSSCWVRLTALFSNSAALASAASHLMRVKFRFFWQRSSHFAVLSSDCAIRSFRAS